MVTRRVGLITLNTFNHVAIILFRVSLIYHRDFANREVNFGIIVPYSLSFSLSSQTVVRLHTGNDLQSPF